MGTVRNVMGNGVGFASAALGFVLGKRARSPWGRALIWAVGAAAPFLANKFQQNGKSGHFMEELGRTWERIKEYIRERREAHSDPADHA